MTASMRSCIVAAEARERQLRLTRDSAAAEVRGEACQQSGQRAQARADRLCAVQIKRAGDGIALPGEPGDVIAAGRNATQCGGWRAPCGCEWWFDTGDPMLTKCPTCGHPVGWELTQPAIGPDLSAQNSQPSSRASG